MALASGLSHTNRDHMRLLLAFLGLSVIGLVRPTSIAAQEANSPARQSRWILVYTGGPHRPAYSVDDFVHLIGIVDTTDRPTGWLCDGAIFVEPYAVSGRSYVRVPTGSPSDGTDWKVYLDSVFAPMGPIARLDSAVQVLSQA